MKNITYYLIKDALPLYFQSKMLRLIVVDTLSVNNRTIHTDLQQSTLYYHLILNFTNITEQDTNDDRSK